MRNGRSANALDQLAVAARRYPPHIASMALEVVTRGALDLLPVVLPAPASVPMASLFERQLSART
jgi:hypothetical protein